MKFLKRSARHNPKLSLILLDWSVRESLHLLHYLGRQDVPRDAFEDGWKPRHSMVSDNASTRGPRPAPRPLPALRECSS